MFNSIPSVTRALLIINIAVFAIQVLGGDARMVALFGLWPVSVLGNVEIGGGAFLPLADSYL